MFKPDFLIIPYQLIEDEELNSLEPKVYAVIYYLERFKQGKCTASNQTIADIIKAHPMSVSKSIGVLEERGYIRITYSGNGNQEREINCNITMTPSVPRLRALSPQTEGTLSPQAYEVSNTKTRILTPLPPLRGDEGLEEEYEDPYSVVPDEEYVSLKERRKKDARRAGVQDGKVIDELYAISEKWRGSKFRDALKQRKIISDLLRMGLTKEEVKDMWLGAEELWHLKKKGRMIDWGDVRQNIDKIPSSLHSP